MSKVPTSHNYNSLKLARIRAGISQKELALISGVPVKTIGNLEQGRRNINRCRVDIVYQLASSLGCDMLDILNFKSNSLSDNWLISLIFLSFYMINLQNFVYHPLMSNRIFVLVWHIHNPGVSSAPSQMHKCIFFQKNNKYYQAAHNKNYFCSVIHMITLPY